MLYQLSYLGAAGRRGLAQPAGWIKERQARYSFASWTSASPSWPGTTYRSDNQRPRSMSAQRGEQNGRVFESACFWQIGQVWLTARPR